MADKPDTPTEYGLFNYSDLTGKNLKGVEVEGMNLKNAKASGAYLGESTIQGHKIADVITDKNYYKPQYDRLSQMLKGIRYKRNNPPILTQRFTLPPKPELPNWQKNPKEVNGYKKRIAKTRKDLVKHLQKHKPEEQQP
jgi:hypothetical protein